MTSLLAQATLPDTITFVAAASGVMIGALGVVLSRNPVHSALMLVMTLFGVAVLFVAQEAQFLAAVQVIVYAGAIVVLFLFVIMLLGVDREDALGTEPLRLQRPVAVLLGLIVAAELAVLTGSHWVTGVRNDPQACAQDPATGVRCVVGGSAGNVDKLARSLFTDYLLAFEATSALLVIAIMAAVVLSRRPPSTGRAGPRFEMPGEDASDEALNTRHTAVAGAEPDGGGLS